VAGGKTRPATRRSLTAGLPGSLSGKDARLSILGPHAVGNATASAGSAEAQDLEAEFGPRGSVSRACPQLPRSLRIEMLAP
jgi:hypothetical protein